MKTGLVCAVLFAAPLGAATRCVSLDGAHVPPFTSWAAAATTVHAAVDAAVSGDEILISNGVFLLPSPVIVSAAVSIVGWQGAAATVFDGGLPARSNRCVELRHSGAELRGLTLTRGSAPGVDAAGMGGGVFSATGGTLRACIIAGNHARYCGGGIYLRSGGLVVDCVITVNSAWSGFLPAVGGVYAVRDAHLTNTLIISNRAQYHGGGIVLGTNAALLASTVTCNLASNGCGGAVWALAGSRLARCQLRHNRSAVAGAALQCAAGVTAEWCLIEYNASHAYNGDGAVALAPDCLLSHAIVRANTVSRNGAGNTNADPRFVNTGDEEHHLHASSPCIDAGLVGAWVDGAYDLDGRPRVIGRAPDCGAYEFAPQYWCSFSAVPLAPVVDETVQFDSSAWRYAAEGLYSVALSVSNAAGGVAAGPCRLYHRRAGARRANAVCCVCRAVSFRSNVSDALDSLDRPN